MFSYGTASRLPIPTPSSAPNIGSATTGAAGGGSGIGNNSGSGMNGNNNININATPSTQNYTSQHSGSSLSSLSSLSNSLSSSLSDEDTDNELKVIEEDSSEEDDSTPESLSWTGENESLDQSRDEQLGLTRTIRRLKSDDRIQQIEEEMELEDAPCLPKKSSLYEPFSFSPNTQTHYHMFHSTQSQLQFMQQLPQLPSQTSTTHRAPPSFLPISSTFQLMTEQPQVQALKRIDDSDVEGSKPQLPHILQTQQQIQQQLHIIHSSLQFQVGNTLKGCLRNLANF